MENPLFLIYINQVGETYRGKYLYEFLFSDSIENIDGDGWDEFPASGRPSPPNDIFIKKVGRLESTLKLDVVQNSDTFAVWDAVDGVVPLGYENINAYESYPEKRIHFHFGLPIEDVEAKLYDKDFTLKYEKVHEK
jgi:hypothetical protein